MTGLKYIFQLYTVIYFMEKFLAWFISLNVANIMTSLLETVNKILRLIVAFPNNFGSFNWSFIFVVIGIIFFISDFLID